MTRHPVSVKDRADAAPFRQELLGHLGLRADASEQDVEAAHNVLVEFLELAPRDVNSWAAARSADMDEAFALLSGPEHGLISASRLASRAQRRPAQTPELSRPQPAIRRPRRKQILGAVGAVLLVGVVFGVAQIGKASDVPGTAGAPTGQQTTAPSGGAGVVPVDETKVAALMTKISANPKDLVSLAALGDLYFAAADYRSAEVWGQKVLGVDPKNQKGLLALGAAQFNQGNSLGAKKNWLVAAGLYPKSLEVHYDLGFFYFSQSPPDKANMTAEWNKVIAIDPNSAMAKAVAAHLKTSTATPTAKVTP